MVTDKLGKNADALCRKKLFLLDMDGTFYLGGQIIPGSLEFIEKGVPPEHAADFAGYVFHRQPLDGTRLRRRAHPDRQSRLVRT